MVKEGTEGQLTNVGGQCFLYILGESNMNLQQLSQHAQRRHRCGPDNILAQEVEASRKSFL